MGGRDTWACTDNYDRDHSAAENANATTCYGSQKPDPARGRVKLAPQTVQVHRTLERQPRAADPRVGADWVRRAPAGADRSHFGPVLAFIPSNGDRVHLHPHNSDSMCFHMYAAGHNRSLQDDSLH